MLLLVTLFVLYFLLLPMFPLFPPHIFSHSWPFFMFRFHKLGHPPPGLLGWVQKSHQHGTQLFKVHRFRDVRIKSRLDALVANIANHVGGQRNDGEMLVAVLALPAADIFASLVPVFVGHVEIALTSRISKKLKHVWIR